MMEISKQMDQGTLTVSISGKFMFNDHQAFRKILDAIGEAENQKIHFRLDGLEFVDSAALGMLLLANDEAQKHQKSIALSGASGQVKKMLGMARFDTLFAAG